MDFFLQSLQIFQNAAVFKLLQKRILSMNKSEHILS